MDPLFAIEAISEATAFVPRTMFAVRYKGFGFRQKRDLSETLRTAKGVISQPKCILDRYGTPVKFASRSDSGPLSYFDNNHSGHRTPPFSTAY